MTDRITRKFLQTAVVNTNQALRDAGILADGEWIALTDSGGAKLPVRLEATTDGVRSSTIATNCNFRTALTAVEALRNLAHFASVRPKPESDEADDNAAISANISIFEEGKGHWLLITGELFGPFPTETDAVNAIPGALRSMN